MRVNSPFTSAATSAALGIFIGVVFFTLCPSQVLGRVNTIEVTQKTTENRIRHLIEPLLAKYCHEECKLMNIAVSVEHTSGETLSPGFDDLETRSADELAPASAQIKLLLDDKVGPVSRTKLLDLLQQYLDTLDFPVRIETIVTHFPAPHGSEGKVAELKSRVSKEFLNTLDELLRQFCPQQCLLADYNIQTEAVNGEEAQYGTPGEFFQDGDTAIRVKEVSATLLMDETLLPEEQNNLVEMAKLKTNNLKHVNIVGKSMKFPRPMLTSRNNAGGRAIASEAPPQIQPQGPNETPKESSPKAQAPSKDSKDSNSPPDVRQEKTEKIEKIERVENGDAVQAELQKFKVFGLVFSVSVFALLFFILLSVFRGPQRGQTPISTVHRIIENLTTDPSSHGVSSHIHDTAIPKAATAEIVSKKYEIERLYDDLIEVYAKQPKVAKQVFSRILTEEGTDTTAKCIHLFGEGIVMEMLRDPSLQTDLSQLMDYYVRNQITLTDDEKLDLLKKLNSRTIVGKLMVQGNLTSNSFDFLAEMAAQQILELIRTESLTVKSMVLTQCDAQKRAAIYAQMDPELRMSILTELSRIDYLPKDYIFNVAAALKLKKRDNPKLNTEALPGSDILVGLLERTGQGMQQTVLKNLEMTNPDSARTVKSKLISLNTLQYLRDGQLLEVVLNLKYDELILFLRGAPDSIRKVILSKAPRELVTELETQMETSSVLSRENYLTAERKVLNRMKIMANEGQINLVEVNERMFAEAPTTPPFLHAVPPGHVESSSASRRAAG